jgi:hypothetical protein
VGVDRPEPGSVGQASHPHPSDHRGYLRKALTSWRLTVRPGATTACGWRGRIRHPARPDRDRAGQLLGPGERP